MRASFSEKIQNPRDLLKLKPKTTPQGVWKKLNNVEPKRFAQTKASSAAERLRRSNPSVCRYLTTRIRILK
jgi:hypothetical protein